MLRRLLCALFIFASGIGVVTSAPASDALTVGSTGISTATGSISGVVTDLAATPEESVCVYAIGGTSGVYSATTDASGEYTISDLPQDSYVLEFDPSCDEMVMSSLAVQFYDGQSQDGQPDLVSIDGGAVTGIDATLEPGSAITGSITSSGSAEASVCVFLYSSNDDLFPEEVSSNSSGTYSFASLPYGTYKVLFDPTCLDTIQSPYAYQYYNASAAGTAAFGSATGVVLSSPTGATGIDAQLVQGASVSGTLSAPGTSNLAGVCAEAITQSDSFVEAAGVTDSSGDFTISNLPPATYEILFDPTCSGLRASDYLPVAYDGGAGQTITQGESVVGVSGALSTPATPVQIMTTSLPSTLPSSAYSAPVQADDGTAPYQWSASGLPLGLSIDPATGVISGTTTATGVFPVIVSVVDGSVPPVSETTSMSLIVGQTSTPTTTTTISNVPTPTTTTTTPKTKSVCSPKTKIVTTDKIEVKNGKRTVEVTHKTVDVRKTVAVKTTKKVHGKLVVVVTHKSEIVKVCKTVTTS